jgi:non-specific serine/threonine protein kinase
MTETDASFTLRLLPHGQIAVTADGKPPRWTRGLSERFADSDAAGLLALASTTVPPGAPPSVGFWRDVAAEFLHALCHVPEGTALGSETLAEPSPAQLAEWTLNAPPMAGAEYLNPPVLAGLWRRLTEWSLDQARTCGGLGAFLDSYAPQWARVGRITLHLAENKHDAEFPFAFMATYSAGLSRDGKVRRWPLGRALEEFAGAGRKSELLKLLSPLHAAAKRSRLIEEMVETGDIYHPLVWTPAEAHSFLKEIPLYEESGLLAQLPDWWQRRPRPRVGVTLDKGHGGSLGLDAMLEFQVSIALDDQALTDAEVDAILRANDGLVLLRGRWVEVDGEKLREALDHWRKVEGEVAAGGLSFIEGMRLLAGTTADLDPTDTLPEHAEWSLIEAGPRLRETLAALRSPDGLGGPPPTALRGELRHYQTTGLDWLWLCSQLGVGACLADDMGLGKTIQVLAALLRNKQHSQPGRRKPQPSLLVVPASLIGNWKSEAARFAPDLRLVIAHPSETPRNELTELAADPARRLRGTDLVITTYSMLARLDGLRTAGWDWVILDEAQAIKNPSARQTRAVKQLRSRARVALTGTPVENRLGDLWSIFDFLNPGLLGSAARFKSFAKALENRDHARYAPLRRLIAPYILRRMKTDPAIATDLPDKTEVQAFCGLAKPQAVLYQQAVRELARALDDDSGDAIQRRGLVLAFLLRFKQICNHPSQLTGDGGYTPAASGKFARLAEICGEIASRGEKTLLFTQFREITDPLSSFLAGVFGRPGLLLHGGTAVKQRKKLVADFQRPDGPPFFILSLKAGGAGLNLTEASHVIHFDRWWNPAVENQATDRAFRIGQRRNVLVHKFVTRGTIEEKIDALIRDKQEMADSLLDGGAEKALTETDDELETIPRLRRRLGALRSGRRASRPRTARNGQAAQAGQADRAGRDRRPHDRFELLGQGLVQTRRVVRRL